MAGPATTTATDSEWLVKCWTMDDGLPSTLIVEVAQSDDGYLWLGTGTGLVRFDGMRFVASDLGVPGAAAVRPMATHKAAWFTPAASGVSNAPPRYENNPGQLWLRDGQGNLFIREDHQFKRVPRPPNARGGPVGLRPSSDGATWVQFGTNMHRWFRDRWLAVIGAQEVPDYALSGREGLPGEWWCQVEDQSGRWRNGEFRVAREPNGNSKFHVGAIFSRRDGGGWLLAESGKPDSEYVLYKISPDMVIFDPITVPWGNGVLLFDAFEDRRGNVWLSSTRYGVLRLGVDGKWEVFNSRNGLSTDSTRQMLEDAEGNIWIGSDGGGLYRLARRTFRTYGIADGLTTDNIYAVAPSRDGGIWAGAMGGRGEGLFHLLAGHATNVPGMGPYAWSVYEDASGDVWAGTYESGLFRRHLGQPSSVPGATAYVYALCDDGAGGLWYGGSEMGHVREGIGTAVTGASRTSPVSSLARDAAGTLWIGSTSSGLYSLKGDQISHYGTAEGLLSDDVLCLHVTDGNSLWIGTDHGINCRSNDHFFSLTRADGLSPLAVSGLAEDGRGNVWIHAPNGIFRTTRRELDNFFAGKISHIGNIKYGRDDGLATASSTIGSQSHVCQDRDGRMWFGTLNGAAVVDPATMPVNTNPPPVVIEEIVVNEKPILDPMATTATRPAARFPPGSGQVEIHYAGNSLTAPGKVRFRYRLEGISPEWVEVGDRRFVSFDHLAHGDYRFQVTACNNDEVWNETGAALAFVILPFFWQTVWFKSLVLLASGTGLALGVRWFSLLGARRKLALVAAEAAVERERARISRDMHDDLGASLTRISILSELAGRSLNPSEEAQSHLQSLSSLARGTAASLGELIWTVKPANDHASNLANHLCLCAHEFLRETQIRCRFDIPDQLPELPASAEVRHEVSLVVKEALNNLVKHSGATEARLSFAVVPPGFVVTVSDNGCGIESRNPLGPFGGNGLPNMRRRLERIGGTCEFANLANGGLVVTLTVPNRSI